MSADGEGQAAVKELCISSLHLWCHRDCIVHRIINLVSVLYLVVYYLCYFGCPVESLDQACFSPLWSTILYTFPAADFVLLISARDRLHGKIKSTD